MIGRLVFTLIVASVFVRAVSPDAKLMNLNVVAVDGNQQPVTDLTRDDFRITDDGKNEPIAFFRHVEGKSSELPSLGPGEVSNGGRANARHITVILLDLLNQRVTTESLAVDAIVRQLSGINDADDLFLYALGLDGKLSAIRGFEGAEAGANWTRGIKPLMDGAMKALQKVRPGDTNIINVRIDLTFKALQELGAQISVYPGRKNVVWITDGIPATLGAGRSQTGHTIDYSAQLRQLGDRFARAGVAIYPVRQFMLGGSSENGDLGSIEAISTLTDMSGGRPDAGNDIGSAVQQAIRDLRSYYQLGYYLPDDSSDDKLHSLRVTCTRKGVRIQARAGYLPVKEPEATRADRVTGDVLKSRTEAAEIGMRARLMPDPKVAHQIDLALRIAAGDVALVQDGDRYTGQLRVSLVLYRKDGNAMGVAAVPLKLDYDAAQRDKALRDGIELNRSLTLDGVAMMRIVAFDFGSDAVGSLAIPVDLGAAVPALAH